MLLSANQIYFVPTLSAVVVEGTAGADVVNVWTDTSNNLHVSMQNATGTQNMVFNTATVAQVRFTGGDGDDVFHNSSSIGSLALGDGGNDTLAGGSGKDVLFGGAGNDTLGGGDGDDYLYGEDGADVLKGGAGNDALEGGIGNDVQFGASGNDSLDGGDGDDQLYGEDGADTLTGDAGNDVLQGGIGNDSLFGGTGYDTLRGEDGNDNLYGEADPDWLSGGTGDDVLYGGLSDDVLRGDAGNDALYGEDGSDQLFGDEGADTLTGGAGNDLLGGGADNDSLFGGDGYDTLYGDDGNDNLYGEGNPDWLSGGTGDDLVNGGLSDDMLHGDAGNDTLIGEDGNDQLFGDDGVDTLTGGAGNDLLHGGIGNDALFGSDGYDALYGDDGNDNLYGEGDPDWLSGGTGDDLVNGGLSDDTLHGDAGSDTLAGEDGNDQLFGDDGIDTLTGGLGNDLLHGGADNDALFGSGGYDTLYGGDGNDNLYGEGDPDWLSGGMGDDLLDGGLSDDTLHGDVGNDTLAGADGNDQLFGDDGIDMLSGGAGNDLLHGGIGNDALFGSNGYDTLYGDDGNDNLYGEGDPDWLSGGTGDDLVNGGLSDDILHGDAGSDTLAGEDGNDQLFGEDGADVLTGGANNDLLRGGLGNDSLFGSDGNDTLYGEDGADNLYGEADADWLSGGAGDDLVNGGLNNDTLYGDAGNDTLQAEDGTDLLLGGDGNDGLAGGTGNDVLIGGLGKDALNGDDGDDLLIGGGTQYDQNAAALNALSAAWSSGTPYATRIQTITNSLFTGDLPSADNPAEHTTVSGGHLVDDQVSNTVNGGNGQDWFLETGSMPMYLPSDVDSPLQAQLVNGDSLLLCGEQIMKLTNQMPQVEGYSLYDSLDALRDRQTSEILTSLVPKAENASLEKEHLALMQLVRYDQVTNYAVHSGAWSDPATWHNGLVPADGARVLIPVGVEVQVDGMVPARLTTVRVDGTLSFSTTRNTQLQVDTIVVSDCGELYMGTADAPITRGVTARLSITDTGPIDRTWDPFGISRGLISQGSVSIYGAEVTSYAALAAPLYAGTQTLTLKTIPVGWNVGDELVVAATTEGTTQNEVRHIRSIIGNSVLLDQALTYNHVAPSSDLDIHVANVTRNAVIESQSTAIDRHGHVMFMHNNDVHIAYGGFYHLGRTDKSQPINDPVVLSDWTLKPGTGTNPRARYAVHFHRTGTTNDGDPGTVLGSAVVDSPGWGFVNHSSYVDMTGNVAFDVNGAGFTAEVGDEIGGFYNNIAIGTTGTGESEAIDNREAIQDFGFQGDGFWFQGTGVSVVGNISAGNQDNAFVFYARGLFQARFQTANLVDPSLAGGASSISVGLVPMRDFSGNEGYASHFGLTLRYHLESTTLNEHSVIADSTFWNNEVGVTLPYTENTTLRNVKVIHDSSSQPREGITSNAVSKSDSYENVTVTGYFIGIRPPRQGTSIINGGTFNNTYDVILATALRTDRNVVITNVSPQLRVATEYYPDENNGDPVDLFFVNDTIILNYGPFANQQLYSLAQAASFIPFPTPRADVPSAYVGLTNQQLRDRFGVSIGGAIAPANAFTATNIVGLVAPRV